MRAEAKDTLSQQSFGWRLKKPEIGRLNAALRRAPSYHIWTAPPKL
jgi:hypothetical protein